MGERARVIRGASVSKFSFRNSSCRCIDFRNSNFDFFILYFRNSNGESSDFRFSTFEIWVWDRLNFQIRNSNMRKINILGFEIRVCDLSVFELRSSIVYFWFSEFPISNFRIWDSSLISFELSTSEFECSIFEIRTSPSSGDASNVRLCVELAAAAHVSHMYSYHHWPWGKHAFALSKSFLIRGLLAQEYIAYLP